MQFKSNVNVNFSEHLPGDHDQRSKQHSYQVELTEIPILK